MWKSWGINQAVFRERMDSVLRSMHEINRMIQETNDYRTRSFASTDYGWTETMRDLTMIEDVNGGGRWEGNSNDAQMIMDALNAKGYNIRIVPSDQLLQ
jgi:hypothetical protein